MSTSLYMMLMMCIIFEFIDMGKVTLTTTHQWCTVDQEERTVAFNNSDVCINCRVTIMK